MDDNAPYILAIAECSSINKAAKQMHLSQPALSQRLKQVEARLKAPLFDRGHVPIKPTRAGKTYLSWARKAIEAEDLMKREIAAIVDNSSRQLHVGVSVPRANGLLPHVLERFYAERSGCVVVLHEAAMPENHTRLLSSEEIDFSVFIPTPPEASLFVSERICAEMMMLIVPRNIAAARLLEDRKKESVDPAFAASLPIIMPPGHLKHSWLIESLAKVANVKLNPVLFSCSNELTFEMMSRGLGATIMPNTFVPTSWFSHFDMYPIEGFSRTGSLYYSRLESHEVSEDEKTFMGIVRQIIAARDGGQGEVSLRSV